MRWTPARWPLRLRVAAAFLAAAGVALAGLAVFAHVRLEQALDEGLRDKLDAYADQLEALPVRDRRQSVRALGGDVYAQLLTQQGAVEVSSSLVAEPLPTPESAGADDHRGYVTGRVQVFDDDAAADGERDAESESALLLVRATDEGYLIVATSREDASEVLQQLRGQLLVGVPLALVVAGILGYAVAGAGLRPIDRMRARAATISDRSAGERLPLPAADDELRRLAATLNAMLERLDEGLQRERRFVAEASHELRTPLTLMRTEIELALSQSRSPAELNQALESVGHEVRRLNALAEQLLERASVEGGGLAIEVGPVDLTALGRAVAARFRQAAGDRTITVTAPRTVVVPGDLGRLDRALSNLVDNALRHGAGDIDLGIRATETGAVLTVTDEGAGFARADESALPHNGLGLTIVREIVRAHGGAIDVRVVDGSTQVRVQLPASSP